MLHSLTLEGGVVALTDGEGGGVPQILAEMDSLPLWEEKVLLLRRAALVSLLFPLACVFSSFLP